ncbi:hypothetical protein [Pontibacter indicus]|uniref:hypothetical protein n=1 Tax=Pontibacter indicus TaxID=1317125 RepID=UPI000978054F|nr:hypothetical protein [Pontibacter indicus]
MEKNSSGQRWPAVKIELNQSGVLPAVCKNVALMEAANLESLIFIITKNETVLKDSPMALAHAGAIITTSQVDSDRPCP